MFKKFGLPFLSGMFVFVAPIFVSNVSVTGRHQTASSPLNRESKARIVPRCAHRIPSYRRIGWGIKFAVPKRLRVRKITDVDYQEYLVRTSKGIKPLQLWWGVNMSAGMTEQTEQLVRNSTSSQQWTIQDPTGAERGSDSRGQKAGARFWRVFDVPGAAIAIYEDVPEQEQRDYDAIIDSACFDQR